MRISLHRTTRDHDSLIFRDNAVALDSLVSATQRKHQAIEYERKKLNTNRKNV